MNYTLSTTHKGRLNNPTNTLRGGYMPDLSPNLIHGFFDPIRSAISNIGIPLAETLIPELADPIDAGMAIGSTIQNLHNSSLNRPSNTSTSNLGYSNKDIHTIRSSNQDLINQSKSGNMGLTNKYGLPV